MPVQYVLSCPKVAGHSNGWSDIPSKKEANKKGEEKSIGGKIKKIKKIKKRKKKIKKEGKKEKSTKQKERKGEGRGGRR